MWSVSSRGDSLLLSAVDKPAGWGKGGRQRGWREAVQRWTLGAYGRRPEMIGWRHRRKGWGGTREFCWEKVMRAWGLLGLLREIPEDYWLLSAEEGVTGLSPALRRIVLENIFLRIQKEVCESRSMLPGSSRKSIHEWNILGSSCPG